MAVLWHEFSHSAISANHSSKGVMETPLNIGSVKHFLEGRARSFQTYRWWIILYNDGVPRGKMPNTMRSMLTHLTTVIIILQRV